AISAAVGRFSDREALMPYKDAVAPLVVSRTLGYVFALALMMGIYSLLPMVKEQSPYRTFGDVPSSFHASLSLVLGWLLVFRTNSAYARWWEARTLWGSLVNTSRNLALKLTCIPKLTPADASYLEQRIAEFPVRLKLHLRRETNETDDFLTQAPHFDSVSSVDHPTIPWSHSPASIVQQLYRWLAYAHDHRQLDGDQMRIIDLELARYMEICGACERIARTPIVRSYRTFARQCIWLFLLTLPWGIANEFQWWTIPLTILVSYFMLGLEIVAEQVEEPFGTDEDDLDLDGLCETIRNSVQEIFRHQPASRRAVEEGARSD
ncbi:MAG: bestrophin family protein, partial [Pirellulaceae bacterium]